MCPVSANKLIFFCTGLSLVAGLCSLDVGWEIILHTNVPFEFLLINSLRQYELIQSYNWRCFPKHYFSQIHSWSEIGYTVSSRNRSGRGFASLRWPCPTCLFCGPFERYLKAKFGSNTRPLLTMRWSSALKCIHARIRLVCFPPTCTNNFFWNWRLVDLKKMDWSKPLPCV